MLAITGTYKDGFIKFDKEYKSDKPVKVIVTFLEDVDASSEKKLSFLDFSFSESRNVLKDYKGSLSDAVVEERRSDV